MNNSHKLRSYYRDQISHISPHHHWTTSNLQLNRICIVKCSKSATPDRDESSLFVDIISVDGWIVQYLVVFEKFTLINCTELRRILYSVQGLGWIFALSTSNISPSMITNCIVYLLTFKTVSFTQMSPNIAKSTIFQVLQNNEIQFSSAFDRPDEQPLKVQHQLASSWRAAIVFHVFCIYISLSESSNWLSVDDWDAAGIAGSFAFLSLFVVFIWVNFSDLNWLC